jgi:pantoate--beta-alanine ligase
MKVYYELKDWMKHRSTTNFKNLGFVPTMGALHSGHLSLVTQAKEANDQIAVSIFVNPTQFNNTDDLQKYPRTIEEDLEMLRIAGADSVLLPNEKDIYPNGYNYQVHEIEKSKYLCGAFRPGHFDGVLTVVLKLLHITQPSHCYMGEKDYQQLLLVEQMVQDFFIPLKIVACPTVREASGLAMSSRNQRLSTDGKQLAAKIYATIQKKISTLQVKQELIDLGFDVEYVEDLWGRRFVAAWLENVRLIDNVKL